jgi:hypothetical protein
MMGARLADIFCVICGRALVHSNTVKDVPGLARWSDEGRTDIGRDACHSFSFAGYYERAERVS